MPQTLDDSERGAVVAALLKPLVATLERSGGGRASRLIAHLTESASSILEGADLAAAVRALSGAGLLGLPLVEHCPPGSMGFADYFCMASGTLGEGLERLSRCLSHLSATLDVRLEVDGTTARLVHRERSRPRLSRDLAEFFLGLVARRCREVVGPSMRFIEVTWIHPETESQARCEAFFGAPIRYGADQDALVFDAALLETELVTRDPSISSALEAQFHRTTETFRGDLAITQLRTTLASALAGGPPSLGGIAKHLGISPRTLQRRLGERRLTFQEIVDDVRRAHALEQLENRSLSVTGIATLLGFKEPATFFRAFRRWTGTTPAAYRANGFSAK